MIKTWLISNWIWLVWIISIIYCIYKLSKRYKKSSLDGITGYQPGLDLLAIIVIGPILMIGDIIVNTYRYLKYKIWKKETV